MRARTRIALGGVIGALSLVGAAAVATAAVSVIIARRVITPPSRREEDVAIRSDHAVQCVRRPPYRYPFDSGAVQADNGAGLDEGIIGLDQQSIYRNGAATCNWRYPRGLTRTQAMS